MVKAPCCDKVGLKKGPWTPQEDKILVAFIQKHGHENWRALPKQAGLLRCGKSCRLRWTNYLRPDIKRGDFTREEEDAIIELHEKLGNRWSAIAASLPGRTDNEIKNVWHTHLKKRLKKQLATPDTGVHSVEGIEFKWDLDEQSMNLNLTGETSSSEFSSAIDSSLTTSETHFIQNQDSTDSLESYPEIDESFWSDTQSDNFPAEVTDELQLQFPFSSVYSPELGDGRSSNIDDGMEFWYELLIRATSLEQL